MPSTQAIIELFERRGGDLYAGENISQLAHALQTAYFAVLNQAPDSLVVAALLHDVGHLLHPSSEDAADSTIDRRHENLGTDWLAESFGPDVTSPIRLHVAAKRYLCATDAAYADGLSPASRQTLQLQGGPMTPEEIAAFEQVPQWDRAVLLRTWDDEAKAPARKVPPLEEYRPRLERARRQHR